MLEIIGVEQKTTVVITYGNQASVEPTSPLLEKAY
jgi:hypothetical protein